MGIFDDDGKGDDENAPPSSTTTICRTREPLIEREVEATVRCCDVAKSFLRRSDRRSKQRLEDKIRRVDLDIEEAKRTLEYLDAERNRLVERYTRRVMRRIGKYRHKSDGSFGHVKVGLGICLPELAGHDTRPSMRDGDWPETTSEMAEVVAE